jgi:hypothetical protein
MTVEHIAHRHRYAPQHEKARDKNERGDVFAGGEWDFLHEVFWLS